MAGKFGKWAKTKGGSNVFISAAAQKASGLSDEQLKSGTMSSQELLKAQRSVKGGREAQVAAAMRGTARMGAGGQRQGTVRLTGQGASGVRSTVRARAVSGTGGRQSTLETRRARNVDRVANRNFNRQNARSMGGVGNTLASRPGSSAARMDAQIFRRERYGASGRSPQQMRAEGRRAAGAAIGRASRNTARGGTARRAGRTRQEDRGTMRMGASLRNTFARQARAQTAARSRAGQASGAARRARRERLLGAARAAQAPPTS